MSAVLDVPARPVAEKRPTPVEYVAGLPVQDQEAILFYLVKEMVRENGECGWIPVAAPDGHLGSFLPAKAEQERFERHVPKLTPEENAELRRRAKNPDEYTWLTTEELLAALREADPVEPQPHVVG